MRQIDIWPFGPVACTGSDPLLYLGIILIIWPHYAWGSDMLPLHYFVVSPRDLIMNSAFLVSAVDFSQR